MRDYNRICLIRLLHLSDITRPVRMFIILLIILSELSFLQLYIEKEDT